MKTISTETEVYLSLFKIHIIECFIEAVERTKNMDELNLLKDLRNEIQKFEGWSLI